MYSWNLKSCLLSYVHSDAKSVEASVLVMSTFICIWGLLYGAMKYFMFIVCCLFMCMHSCLMVEEDMVHLQKGHYKIFESMSNYVGFFIFIFSELCLFLSFICAFVYYSSEDDMNYRFELGKWGLPRFMLGVLSITTTVLLVYSYGKSGSNLRLLEIFWFLFGGSVFLVCEMFEFTLFSFSMNKSALTSSFFGMTCLHGFHVIMAVMLFIGYMMFINGESGKSYKTLNKNSYVICTMYWLFVDVLWVLIYSVLYMTL